MSLSNPQSKNPATRFMQWRGGEEGGGRVTYWDKEAEQEVEVALPFSFIVLDELNTITGFSERDQSGFWSNEVRNLQSDQLIVRTKSGIKERGKYADIADKIKAGGAKYAKSVYVAFKDDSGELAIGNIKIAGAALTAWIEFEKKFDVSQCAVFITETPKRAKKGKNTYFVPIFEGQNMSEATKSEAVALDQELQQYLNSYFQREPDLDDSEQEEVDDEPLAPSKPVKGVDVDIENLDDQEDVGEEETPAEKPESVVRPLKDVAF